MHRILIRPGCVGILLVAFLALAADETGFKPVAGPRPLLQVSELSLGSARDWLAQKDLISLAQSGPELELLARLLAVQGSAPDWQKGTANLENLARKLGPACRAKNHTQADEILKAYQDQLTALHKVQVGESKMLASFKASGGVKTWMLALDFAYHEAKSSKTPERMSSLARALAEEANALQFLRGDARWRTYSQQVRDHALQAAQAASDNKLEIAGKHLLQAFERCEACHQNKK